MKDERGYSNSVQLTVLFPLAFVIFLGVVQWALVSWAQASALAAAQDGAAVAAAFDGTTQAGQQAAQLAADNGSMGSFSVDVQRGPQQTRVTVRGTAHTLLPELMGTVEKTVDRPTERLVP
ncbi:MAG: TadE/TadG family type IV pilus assembly protein [Tessaracoccus sp.]